MLLKRNSLKETRSRINRKRNKAGPFEENHDSEKMTGWGSQERSNVVRSRNRQNTFSTEKYDIFKDCKRIGYFHGIPFVLLSNHHCSFVKSNIQAINPFDINGCPTNSARRKRIAQNDMGRGKTIRKTTKRR